MTEVNSALSKARKKRAVADTVATPEDIAGFALLGSHAVHSARSGGIHGIDTHPDNVGGGALLRGAGPLLGTAARS